MKCPECVENGEKSQLTESPYSLSTSMGTRRFWDEDGIHHYHDPNSHTTSYSCSKGHSFSKSNRTKCQSCDYNFEEKDK